MLLLSTTDIGAAMAVYVGWAKKHAGMGWHKGLGPVTVGVPGVVTADSEGLTGLHRKKRS